MRRSTRRPANGPLVTCPPLARKSVMSALVIATNAARGSGSVMATIVRGSPGQPVGGTLPQDRRNATNDPQSASCAADLPKRGAPDTEPGAVGESAGGALPN